ncbi:hypothetical protein F8M41_000751 [Gigaspora margarita]|uniref:F-box domain-containing protein n=1 Tax=Gigaspora margarita TaxID=4874 RepID=A0A8H4AZE5_GIGMA|nr:hypothetical protein F8M41_000751 [Gigaspora margarita]
MPSKIFTGDMPELMESILNNLNNEFNSLYSCALVSRHWCKISIPILWQDPFSFRKSSLFISKYFSSLDEDEKFVLKECGINTESSKTLFDYAQFIKVLEISRLERKVQEWIEFQLARSIPIYLSPQLFQALIHIIESQEQLKQFSLVGEEYPAKFHGIISALDSQKNSLQEVIIERCYYNKEFEVMTNCKNLETLRMRYFFDYSELLNVLNDKISTLEIVDFQINASTIVQILKKSGIRLQRLKLDSKTEIMEESLLLETLKSFCPNIIYLNISLINISTQLLELIGNLQKLQFLTLGDSGDTLEEELKIRVMQFAEILPLTLQYLDLRFSWLVLYIDILLNHCNAPLKKLFIDRLDSEKDAKELIEFCRRNRTLNYVGVTYSNMNEYIRKNIETYFTLVPCERIIVNC